MQNFELENAELKALDKESLSDTNGGLDPVTTGILIGIGCSLAAAAIYDMANGAYTRLKQEFN